jgi:hypothetical protein
MASENERLAPIHLWAFWIAVALCILLSYLPIDFDLSALGMAVVTACVCGFGRSRGSHSRIALALAVLGAGILMLIVIFNAMDGMGSAEIERVLQLSKSARQPHSSRVDGIGLAFAYGTLFGAAIRLIRALWNRRSSIVRQ